MRRFELGKRLAVTVRGWTPPKLRNWLVGQFAGVRSVSRWPSAVSGGWHDAVQAAKEGHRDGFSRVTSGASVGFLPGEDLGSFSESSRQYHDRLVQFALVAARIAVGRDELRVLDYGGGFGLHARALKRLLPALRVQYTVAELPAFCDAGRALNPDVRFVPGLHEAGDGYHLVYASSSMQYSENWRGVIGDLCDAATQGLFITRTPFVFGRPAFVTVQRAYNTEYPGWVFNYEEVVHEVIQRGFNLSEVFLNGSGIPVRGLSKPNVHLGLLFERPAAPARADASR
jgi:putative methyltransferase (TIGR04325 family)